MGHLALSTRRLRIHYLALSGFGFLTILPVIYKMLDQNGAFNHLLPDVRSGYYSPDIGSDPFTIQPDTPKILR